MKLNSLPLIEQLEPLKALKPMRTEKIFILNHISNAKLLLLSAELLYQCKLAFDFGKYDSDLIHRRILWAIKLLNATDTPNELYFKSDIKRICKALKIKNPL